MINYKLSTNLKEVDEKLTNSIQTFETIKKDEIDLTHIQNKINDFDKKKRIEIINLYTKKVIKITSNDGRYLSPVWILRKI